MPDNEPWTREAPTSDLKAVDQNQPIVKPTVEPWSREAPSNINTYDEKQTPNYRDKDLVKGEIQMGSATPEDKKAYLQSLYGKVSDSNANDNADALAISQKTGIDPDKVLNNLKEAKSAMSAPDKEYWDNLQSRSPGLARFLEDPKNMAACHNSLQGLSDTEGKIRDLYKGTLKGVSFGEGALDFAQSILNKAIGVDNDWPTPDSWANQKEKLDKYIKTISTPTADTSWTDAYNKKDYNALAAKLTLEIPFVASLVVLHVVSGGLSTGSYLGLGTAGDSYEESKKNGLSDEAALASAGVKGTIAGATMLPVLNVFSKAYPAIASVLGEEGAKTTFRIAMTNFAKSTLGMAAQNDAQLFGNEAVDKISGENPRAFENFGDKLKESTIGGLTIGGAMGVPHFLGIGAKTESDKIKDQVKQAEETKKKFIELSKSAPEMNVDMAQKAIRAFTEEHGVKNVRIPIEEFERLYQEEGPEKVAKQFGEEALKSYQEPGTTEVVIPMEKFLTSERKSDAEKISDHVKFDIKSDTLSEVKAKQKVLSENEIELKKIKEEFKDKTFGSMVAQGYKTFSERTGKSVKELKEMFGFEQLKEHAPVLSEDKQKEIFGVSAPEKFFQSEYDKFFKKNNLSEEEIKKRQRQLEGMKAAVKDPESGRVFTASTGTEGHFAAFEQARFAGYKNVQDSDAGFLLGDGKFVYRKESNDKFGVLRSGQIPETLEARDFIANRKPITDEDSSMFNQNNRGSMQLAYDPLTKKITFKVLLNDNSDKSTMFHEIGHAFLFMMKHLSELEGAPKDLKEDSESYLKWVGAKSWDDVFSKEGGKYTKEAREMHEKFARGFEYRLWEGNVPVPGMKRMFDRFMNWIREVYPTADIMQRYLGAEMTPRMRGVYDRILASQDEIKEAENTMGYNSEAPEGIDPSDIDLWTNRYAKATQDAIDVNLKARMKSYMEHGEDEDVARAHAEKDIIYRSVEEVIEQKIRNLIPYDNVEESHAYALAESKAEKEVESDPKYKMIDEFGFKNYKEEAQKFLDGDRSKENLFTELSIKYGYEDGSKVAEIMINADKEYEIKEKIKDDLSIGKPMVYDEQTRGEISTLYGDKRSEALGAELNLYKKMSNEDIKNTLEEVNKVKKQTQEEDRAAISALKEKAKEQARINLSGKGLTEAKSYSTYITASKNAAIKASEYVKKKDYANASLWKEKELINHEMAKQAIKNSDIIRKFESKAKDLADRTSIDNRPLLTVPVGHAKIAHGLLEKFGLADKVKPQPDGTWESMADNMEGKSQKEISDATGMTGAQGSWKPETISSFFSRLKSEGLEHAGLSDYIPIDLMTSGPMDKDKLTLGELETVVNAVSAIYTDGRKENKLFLDNSKTDLKIITKALSTAIKENVGDSHSDRAKESKHWWTSIADKTLLEMGQIETLAEIVDGGPDGQFHKFFSRPIRDCDNKERELMHERVKLGLDIAEKHFGKDGIGKRMNEKVSIDTGNGKMRDFTIGELYGIIRYIGTRAGKADIIKGNGFDEATIERMKDKLTTKDMDYISDMAKEDEKFWPMFVAQELRDHGVAPRPAEKIPVTFKGKTYDGWYYHKSYDKNYGTQIKQVEVSRPGEMNSFKPFNVNNGFLKERVEEGTGKALNIKPEVYEQYLKDTCHYLAWQEGIRDANKILRNKDVKSALEDAFTVRGASVFQTQINYLACGNDDVKGVVDKILRYGRVTNIFYNIGYRAPMFLVKYGTDVNNIFWEKGLSHASNIMFNYGINPWSEKLNDLVEKVQQLEPSMKYRSEFFSYDAKTLHDALSGKNKILSFVEHTTFVSERYADKIVSHVEWYRVYSDAIKEGKDEQTAKYMASETVDNLLGSASKLQHTAVMRGGELTKSLSPAYQVFATMYMRAYKMGKQVGPAYDKDGFLAASAVVARMIVRYPIMMGLIGFGAKELFRNPTLGKSNKDEGEERKKRLKDEGEERKKRLWERLGVAPFEITPGTRNIADFAYQSIVHKGIAYKPVLHMLPIEELIENGVNAGIFTGKMMFDNKKFKEQDAKKMIEFYSEVSRVPKLIDTWAENLYDDIAENGHATIRDLFTKKTRY